MEYPSKAAHALFRTEAIAASANHLGRPVAPLALPTWILSSLLLLIVLAIGLFLAVGTYARKETVSGRIFAAEGAPGVVAPRAGVIEEIRVDEGHTVRAGDVIATLRTEATLASGVRVGERLARALESQASAKADEANARWARLTAQRKELHLRGVALRARGRLLVDEMALQRERIALAETTVRDLRPLFEAHQIAAIQYRQYEEALLDARQQAALLAREQQALHGEIAQLQASDALLVAEAASLEAQVKSDLAAIEEKRVGLDGERAQALIAPIDGIVAALALRPGDPVVPGQTRAVVVPVGSRMHAELWVPSKAIGFVSPGHAVRLMYDAFPYQRFGFGSGQVVSVADAPMPPGEVAAGGLPSSEPLFRVMVDVPDPWIQAYGEQRPLLPGMTLSADLVLEERSFLDWLLDPLRAARKRA